MEQHLMSEGPLLDNKGNLVERGYAFSLVKTYDRKMIKANKMRIKEWDYYYVGNQKYGIALTIADNSYMALASVSFLNFENKKEHTKSYMGWFTNGKLGLPSSSTNGDVSYKGKKFSITFHNEFGKRRIECYFKDLVKGRDIKADFTLKETNGQSMVIATPFKKNKHFYYNQKINLLSAKGSFTYKGKEYNLDDAYGVLDWGRGVWTYKNTWFWSSLSGVCDGHRIGFNLGYGFGDTSSASENMLFFDDQAIKFDDVKFEIPQVNGKDDFLGEWKIYSKSKDIDLTFTPLLDRHADTNVLIIRSNQHQVFGKFNGTFTKNGDVYKITNLIGFAEKVLNKW